MPPFFCLPPSLIRHLSCGIEIFSFETHLCKLLCDTPIAHATWFMLRSRVEDSSEDKKVYNSAKRGKISSKFMFLHNAVCDA